MAQTKALIAMSGGVDSSVAAYLMKAQGYTCDGATLRMWENGSDSNRFMGIGLQVCKTIVDAHGGVISAQNLPRGGAEFSFTIQKETKKDEYPG